MTSTETVAPVSAGQLGLTWGRQRWTAGWLATYYGPSVDTGTATTKELYDVLEPPDYISTHVDSGGDRRDRSPVTSLTFHNGYVNDPFP
jgi:hypothetical protein